MSSAVSLDIHFLNVGHGDCTLLDFPSGRLMMIDVNNSDSLPEADQVALAESVHLPLSLFKSAQLTAAGTRTWEEHYRALLVDPYVYYQSHFPTRTIFRYIQTHPDLDHMSGLHRFFWQEKVPLVNFWDVKHSKMLQESDFENSRYSWLDWATYLLLRSGKGPNDAHKVIRNLRGSEGEYWTDDGIGVFAPTAELLTLCDKMEDWNDASYILKIQYGGRSVILPGDAEWFAWQAALNSLGETNLSCDILKAAHHGRESGFHRDAAEAMRPEIVICSVGKKPETDASDEYAALGAKVLSTRYHGTITVRIWFDGEVWVQDANGGELASLPPLQ